MSLTRTPVTTRRFHTPHRYTPAPGGRPCAVRKVLGATSAIGPRGDEVAFGHAVAAADGGCVGDTDGGVGGGWAGLWAGKQEVCWVVG